MTIRTKDTYAIIFDLDRTLIKSETGSNKALKGTAKILTRYLRRQGHTVSRVNVYKTLRPIAKSFEHRGIYNRDEWWITLLRRLGLSSPSGKWVHKVTLQYWNEYIAASPPYEDAPYTLRTLRKRGYQLAMVSDTDGTPGMKRRRIRTLPFYRLFKTVVIAGEDSPKIKPSKIPLSLVAERLRLSPKMCVYVGDNPRVDVKGAKAVGMQTILVKRHELKGDRPTLVIKSLSQLLRIYKGVSR